MPGTWLAAIAKWMTREDTFERLVSPAIADLQNEAARGPIARACHYAAVGVVMGWALTRDLLMDVTDAFDADARRQVWMRAALWFLPFAGLSAWLGVRESLIVLGPEARAAALTSALVAAPLAGIGPAMTAAVFYLIRRRAATARTIAAAALVVAAAGLVIAAAVHPVRLSADRELYEAGRSLIATEHAGTSLLRTWVEFQAGDIEPFLAWGRDVRNALGVIVSALLGVILARTKRPWMVPLNVVLFAAASFAVWLFLVLPLEHRFFWEAPSQVLQAWRTLAIQCLIAVTWIALGTRTARRAFAAALLAAARAVDPPARGATQS